MPRWGRQAHGQLNDDISITLGRHFPSMMFIPMPRFPIELPPFCFLHAIFTTCRLLLKESQALIFPAIVLPADLIISEASGLRHAKVWWLVRMLGMPRHDTEARLDRPENHASCSSHARR